MNEGTAIMILIVWIQGLAKQTRAEHNGNKFIIYCIATWTQRHEEDKTKQAF
jgi:hypothetical protein